MNPPNWMGIAALCLTVLCGLMVVLKLFGVIAWPWWIVLLPMIGPAAVIALVVLMVVLWARDGFH